MEIDDQNASGLAGVQPGTTAPNAKPLNTAMWLSSLDPVSSQIMESLITSNAGPQALASSFNLFNFIFQNFENFANELNRNPIDENFRIKIERPTEPKERPNPNNAFEMIRTMRGHISAGMWALILYCKEGYLAVHLLPSDFIASIIDDKMSDFPAYLEITQQQGQPGTWQIENKPIVIEVIPGLIRHLVEHLVRVSRQEAPANERFSFFTPRKTKENSGVFSMPASVQAAIAGEVLPENSSSNGGGYSAPSVPIMAPPAPLTPAAFAPPPPQPQIQAPPPVQVQAPAPAAAKLTRSQTIKNMMQEARLQADSALNSNQIFYNNPNQATLAQENTVAVQQFSLPGAPELNFKNPSASGTNVQASPPAFLAPPAGLFGGGPGASSQKQNPGLLSPPPSLLSNSSTDANAIDTPNAFNTPPQSPFARPAATPSPSGLTPPAQNPGVSATSLAALLNNASNPAAPPAAPVPPPQQPASLSQSGVMAAPPPPPGLQRPLPPPGIPGSFSAPPSPPPPPVPAGSSAGSPPPLPMGAPPSPPPPPSFSAPPPPPAPPIPTPAQQPTAVPVVPFPQFTQTSMPAAPVPESLILDEAAKAEQPGSILPAQSPLSLFDDEDEAQEPIVEAQLETDKVENSQFASPEEESSSPNEQIEPNPFSESDQDQPMELFDENEVEESGEVYQSSEELQENSEASYEQDEQVYEQSSEYESEEESVQYEQGGYEEQANYDGETNYQEYASDESSQGEEEVQYEQYETDESYQMNGEVNGFAASIQDPLDSPEALIQIMEQSQRVVRDGCFQILGELDLVLDSLRAAAQVAMHNDNIQAVTDIMQHSKQIKALRERLVSFKEENIKEDE